MVQFVILVCLLGWLIYTYWHLLTDAILYYQDNLTQAVLLGLTFLMVWGVVFPGLGLPDLIWHEDWFPRLLSAASVVLLVGLFHINAYYLWIQDKPEHWGGIREFFEKRWVGRLIGKLHVYGDGVSLWLFLLVTLPPLMVLLILPVFLPGVFIRVPGPTPDDGLLAYLGGLLLWTAGLLIGVLAMAATLCVGEYIKKDYTNPFANATGQVARSILRVFEGSLHLASRIAEGVWSLAAERWQRLVHPTDAGPEGSGRAVEDIAQTPDPPTPPETPQAEGTPEQSTSTKLEVASSGEQENVGRIQDLFLFVVVVAASFIGLNLVNIYWPDTVPPAVAIFTLLGLLVIVDGLSRLVLPPRYWYWRFPAAVLVVAFIAFANRKTDKLQFENMAYDPWSRVDLRDRVAREYLPRRGAAAGNKDTADGLIDDKEAREAWLVRAKKANGGRTPKLVVLCCSGGGARSLAWTSTVLDRLGKTIPGFDESVRIVVAGSSGAVGAGYYLKARYDRLPESRTPPWPPDLRLASPGWSENIPADNESGIMRSIALAELWRMFDPFPVRGAPPDDRGRVLERNWDQLRQLPLEELRPVERRGLVPSLILAPLTLEDGRRLFISNLDLNAVGPIRALPPDAVGAPAEVALALRFAPSHGLALVGGSELLFGDEAWSSSKPYDELRLLIEDVESGRDFYPEPESERQEKSPVLPIPPRRSVRKRGRPVDVARTNHSLTGVEFARVFDRSRGFRLATAARMSATVPMITPAVYLPSQPELRVADSGFYDNYGVDIAAAWIFRNRAWLKANTSGVLLVQIRAMGRREERTDVVRPGADPFAQWLKGFQLIGSVGEGAMHSFSTQSIFRNDCLVAGLSELFNGHTDSPDGARHFFTTVVFENTAIVRADPARHPDPASTEDLDASYGALSWRLSRTEARSVRAAFPGCRIRWMPSVKNVGDLPGEGQDLVIIARINEQLHLRVFDHEGRQLPDTNEKQWKGGEDRIEDLNRVLESLGARQELTGVESYRVARALVPVLDSKSTDHLITGFGPALQLTQADVDRRIWNPEQQPDAGMEAVEKQVASIEERIAHPSSAEGTDQDEIRAALTWKLEKLCNRERLLSLAAWWQRDPIPAK